jgi:hypothetical protein
VDVPCLCAPGLRRDGLRMANAKADPNSNYRHRRLEAAA